MYESTLIDSAIFRQALSRLAAGTSIVTLMDQKQVMMGLTATAVTSVSLEPPLVLVCIDNRSRTLAALQSGVAFVINILSRQQQSLAYQFAGSSDDKFSGVAYTISETGGIHLNGVLASIECTPHKLYLAGDHTIIVGLVTRIYAEGDDQPLVYFRSQFL